MLKIKVQWRNSIEDTLGILGHCEFADLGDFIVDWFYGVTRQIQGSTDIFIILFCVGTNLDSEYSLLQVHHR